MADLGVGHVRYKMSITYVVIIESKKCSTKEVIVGIILTGISLERPNHELCEYQHIKLQELFNSMKKKIRINDFIPIISHGKKESFFVYGRKPRTRDKCKKKCYKLSFCSYFSEYLIRKKSSINVKLDFVEEKNIAWS